MSTESSIAYAEALPSVVHDLAEPHVASSGGTMVHLDWDPEQYPFQKPECYRWDSGYVVQGVEGRLPFAEELQPGYGIIRDGLLQDELSGSALDSATIEISKGKNVVVVTAHDNIVDIAVALLAAKDGIESRDQRVATTAIMLSKMLSGIGYKKEYIDPSSSVKKVEHVPAVYALGLLCEVTYLSWPNTDSAKAHTVRLPADQRNNNNRRVVVDTHERLNNGAVLLGLAATGTTRIESMSKGGVILPGLSPGTVNIMKRPDTILLPMLLNLEPGQLSARIPYMPVNPEDKHGVDDFMRQLETEFNQQRRSV